MALDGVTTSLVGLAVGAVGVLAHLGSHHFDGALQRSRERTLMALLFTFIAGFLFPWVWVFAGTSLVAAIGLSGVVAGFLWGGLLWGAFMLPSEISHIVWGRQPLRSSVAGLAGWLGQFLIGGALCGAYLLG